MNEKTVYVLIIRTSECGQFTHSINVEAFSTKKAGDKAFSLKVKTESKNLRESCGRCRVYRWAKQTLNGKMRGAELTSSIDVVDISLMPVRMKD